MVLSLYSYVVISSVCLRDSVDFIYLRNNEKEARWLVRRGKKTGFYYDSSPKYFITILRFYDFTICLRGIRSIRLMKFLGRDGSFEWERPVYK